MTKLLLVILQLTAPPHRIPGLPADLSFPNVTGAVAYQMTGVNVINIGAPCQTINYGAAFFCQHEQGKRCSLPVPTNECIYSVYAVSDDDFDGTVEASDSDGTLTVGPPTPEAHIETRANGGTGAPCYYPHDAGCVYP